MSESYLSALPSRETAKRQKMAAASGADRLSALPEALLRHVLSFLPSRDAVRTCVLARGWRHQWKSVPALRIADAQSYASAHALNKFVNYLLLLRDRSPLHECEIRSCHDDDCDETFRYTELWIRYAVACQVQVIRIHNDVVDWRWQVPRMPLTSRHLTRLELYGVESYGCFLDFSTCPALEELKISFCTLSIKKISSPSLRRLSITSCDFIRDARTQISAPNLVSFELADFLGWTPLVERMPSLVSAFVRIGQLCRDWCSNGYETGDCGDNSCEGCSHSNGQSNNCILLEGLSDAVNLEMTAATRALIFRKDLTSCPAFSNLKTLLLNEWCLTDKLGALICFLQHSPIIEKLTLQFCESPEEIVENEASYNRAEQSFASKNLTVEVKCPEVDERISRVLDALRTYGVSHEQIKIQQSPQADAWPFGSFSFEQGKI